MRLIVFGPGYPFRGGIARTTSELARALEREGHEVSFLTPVRQYPAWLYPGRDDRDPAACPKLECALPVLDPFAPGTWPGARQAALGWDADAWVVPYWTWAWVGLWAYLLRVDRRPPAVAVVHNPVDHEEGALKRIAAGMVLSRCQALFTHAEALRLILAAGYPGIPTAAHPLPAVIAGRGIDRARARQALALPVEARVAVFVGLIRPYKGVDVLLEAFARLPADGTWRLLVAGEPWGELGPALHRQVLRLGLAERVTLDLRWVAEDELERLLAAADVVVLPYRSGSQSALAPEALARGVPVVTTRVGGLPEVVQHGVNGLVVAPGAVDELSAALAGLDDDALTRLAAGARATGARLSWAGYVAALERLIEQVTCVSTKKPTPGGGL